MAVLDYVGRKFDVLSFNGVQLVGTPELQQSLFSYDANGTVCTGTQKLAQRWLLEFLTERGSMKFHLSNRGSDFMKWQRSGRMRSEFDVQAFFNFAAQQVRTNLLNEETATMPADERFQSAILSQIILTGETLDLVIRIQSVAGDDREIILPIRLTPTNLQV